MKWLRNLRNNMRLLLRNRKLLWNGVKYLMVFTTFRMLAYFIEFITAYTVLVLSLWVLGVAYPSIPLAMVFYLALKFIK